MSYVCESARKTVSVPLINAGTHNPDSALALIESGNADFASFGRALIADPEMPKKLLQGRVEDIRPCLRCNEYCIGRIWNKHTKLSCAVNPQAMEEVRFRLTKTENPQNIVIIGGGPAGMEAARVAAWEGHKVTLFEKDDHLGGTMRTIATAAFKVNIRKLADWYDVQLKKLGVDIRLNTEVTGDEEILKTCDQIFVGCGAKPIIPHIPGIDGANVITMIDGHKDASRIKGENIVVCGGGASAVDGALEMAEEMGKKVTIVEMLPEIGKDIFFINKITVMNKIAADGIVLMPNTKVVSIDEKGVNAETADGQIHIDADTVIAAFGMRPDTTLADKIKEKYHTKTRVIGDTMKLGKIGEAVREGFYAASALD
jgi:NADPH-dependent 2,4-dienoyl-CoA reductase/sulfur reductase-like enzyme